MDIIAHNEGPCYFSLSKQELFLEILKTHIFKN